MGGGDLVAWPQFDRAPLMHWMARFQYPSVPGRSECLHFPWIANELQWQSEGSTQQITLY